MKLAIVYTRAQQGIHAPLVTVEVHISSGLPSFSIVGLPETVVRESKERVRSAIINSKLVFPKNRITVNLAPADLPKDGGRYDLPIALGILAASEQIPLAPLSEYEFAGELALSGELREIKNTLPFVINATNGRKVIIPEKNSYEVFHTNKNPLFVAKNLKEVYEHLCFNKTLPQPVKDSSASVVDNELDLIEVKGQAQAKRALEISAAGGHNLLMVGPPGTGKTMLANRLPSLIPNLSLQKALEVASIPANTNLKILYHRRPPFRMPHHTASVAAIIGGNSPPCPGEISLAHNGILFMDEFSEFNKKVLEALREPLETGFITISRAKYQETFPSRFQLIAAMNPCPCGQLTNEHANCNCTPEQIRKYLGKISFPILDRIDLQIQMSSPRSNIFSTTNEKTKESSATVKNRVIAAREVQLARNAKLNAKLSNKEMNSSCKLTATAQKCLESATDKFNLSIRSYYKVIKVAQTISDLAAEPLIEEKYISEALSLRILDKLKLAEYC